MFTKQDMTNRVAVRLYHPYAQKQKARNSGQSQAGQIGLYGP